MKTATAFTRWLCLILLLFSINSCLKDQCQRTYTIYRPVYKTLAQVRADMKSWAPQSLKNTGKLYVWGKYIFVNEIDKGIHVIDNSDPANAKNVAFIYIPGNVDMAIKGNYLYADAHNDLVVLDVSNPVNATTKKFVNDVFPNRRQFVVDSMTYSHPDSVMVIVDYKASDTAVDCKTYNYWYGCMNCAMADASGNRFYAAPPTGVGGSMARFTILSDYLYTVTYSELYTFNISNAANPGLVNKNDLGSWQIETIYPFKDRLFIGSNSGMFIYDVSSPASPSPLGQFSHVRSCDPVIADDNYAFVTLRSGNQCQGFTNQMEVLDITQLTSPRLVKTYSLTNPHGLSKDGKWLFICDGNDGLKVYDASDVNNLQIKAHLKGPETYDVIAMNNVAMVVAKDGLYQYDYSDISDIRLLSKVELSK